MVNAATHSSPLLEGRGRGWGGQFDPHEGYEEANPPPASPFQGRGKKDRVLNRKAQPPPLRTPLPRPIATPEPHRHQGLPKPLHPPSPAPHPEETAPAARTDANGNVRSPPPPHAEPVDARQTTQPDRSRTSARDSPPRWRTPPPPRSARPIQTTARRLPHPAKHPPPPPVAAAIRLKSSRSSPHR